MTFRLAVLTAASILSLAAADLEVATGPAWFLDADRHALVGGSARSSVTRNWSIRPEVTYYYANSADSDLVTGIYVVRDINIRSRKATPYVLFGGGLVTEFRRFGTDYSGSLAVGVGIRAHITPRVYFAPEFRIGWSPLVQARIGIGYVFAK